MANTYTTPLTGMHIMILCLFSDMLFACIGAILFATAAYIHPLKMATITASLSYSVGEVQLHMNVFVSWCDMLSLTFMNNVQASSRLTRAGAALGAPVSSGRRKNEN